MLRLGGKLIAVPFRLVADVVEFLKIADPTRFISTAWKFGNDPKDGAELLTLLSFKRGIMRAREIAEAMIAKENDSLLASTMGWLEIKFSQGFEASKKWLEAAKKTQAKRQELLLNLELYLSQTSSGYDASEITEKILARNDLPMDTSRYALLVKAEIFLQKRKWDSASRLADKILDLEENPSARWVKWTAALAQGNDADAALHIKKIGNMWPDAYLYSFSALGWFYIGDVAQALKLMHQAEDAGAKFEYISRELATLANSDEYKNSTGKNS